MWRVLLVGVVLAGCDGATEQTDAGAATERFSPIVCTSGMPGDPSCPLNDVDLGTAFALRASFVAKPMGRGLDISEFTLNGTATSAAGVSIEVWCADCYQPLSSVLVAQTLDVGVAAPTVTITQFATSETLKLRIDAIR